MERGIPLNTANLVIFSAVAMIVAGCGFMIVEAIVASAWTSPPYSYVYDQLPDLGNPTCGPFQGRVVCSPLDGLMNAMFVVHGFLFGFAGILLSRLMAGTARVAVFVLALVYVIGLSMITVFHQYAGMPAIVEVLNITGAFLGILAGSTITIIFGSQQRRLHLPPWLGPASMALGVVGIVAGIVFFAFSLAPLGIRERVSIYPLMLWQIVAGLALLWAWRGRREGATTERDTGDYGRVSWTLLVSAYLVPVMIVAQFAWLATVPVLVLLVSTFRNVRNRLVRWLAVLLAVVYAAPYAIWKLRPDPAPSLSKDMDPVFAALIIAASAAFIVAIHVVSRRGSRTA